MANNRLFLYDPDSHEAFLLAKSLGDGWYMSPRHELDDMMERLDRWFQLRDMDASYGNCFNGITTLQLCTEGNLPPNALLSGDAKELINE